MQAHSLTYPEGMDTQQIIWEAIVTVSAVYMALTIPLNLVFNFNETNPYNIFSIIVSIIFLLDIPLRIILLRNKTKEILFEQQDSIIYYLKYFLIFDLIAAIPYEIIFPLSAFQLLRLTKLIRVGQVMNYLRQNILQHSILLRFIFFSFWILLSAHWISCGWVWLRGIDFFQDSFTNYIRSFYWTVTTLSTVGYGDIVPQNNLQTLFAIFVMILGVGVYSFLIGNIAGILSKRDPSKAQYMANLEKLNALIHFREIPFDLQKKIRDFYKYIWRQKLGYDEVSFLNGLPEGLKQELSLNLKKNSVEKIDLFKKAGNEFIKEIALHLELVVFSPGEFIFKGGDAGNKMYFVINGRLSAYSKNDDKLLASFKEGDYFGEMALFKNIPRTANIIADTYSDLYALSKNSFDYVLIKYPFVASEIEEMVKRREAKL